jgi:hypothetical protein
MIYSKKLDALDAEIPNALVNAYLGFLGKKKAISYPLVN